MMKKLLKLAAAALIGATAIPATAQMAEVSAPVPSREHRSIWMSPFLGSNWPSAAITKSNAESHKRILRNQLQKFADYNINVLYYHVRSNCDANYNSAYEPWSSSVGGSRGTAPFFDPFEFLVEEAHKVGIEVYAWVNPYRYANGTSATPYGEGERNYETTHPEWLLINGSQSVLNPGIDEVRQRVVDVVADIVNKYDVDGVCFDDYFYGQGGTNMSADATQYNAYKTAGGTLSQADWRRDNINRMVHDVYSKIKELKPWVAFGISPAGVASPPTCKSEYGLDPYTGGSSDWQYSTIYSDPLAWLKAGTIDFVSPQIYWPSQYEKLSQWWAGAGEKLGRHVYPSVDLSDIATIKAGEMVHEVDWARQVNAAGTSGTVYFEYGKFVNYSEKYDGATRQKFGEILRDAVYPTKALTPLRPWDGEKAVVFTKNVSINAEAKTLDWDAVDGMRYTVYAHQKAQSAPFSGAIEDMKQVVYTNQYALPEDYADYDWYVAVYDRWGNEFPPLGVGAQPGSAKGAALTYPADGETPVDLFNFSWTHENAGVWTIEVAEDSEFKQMVGSAETSEMSLSVTQLPALTPGKTYWWRVKCKPVNAYPSVSEARKFVASRIAVVAPADGATDVALPPEISWSRAVDGAEYSFVLSAQADLGKPVMELTTADCKVAIPAKTLNSGRKYYMQVKATKDGYTSASAVATFSTADRSDYAAPVLVSPSADGVTLHSNDCIEVAPWDGMSTVQVQISTSSSFPRTSYTATLSNFAEKDKTLENVKISSKNLVDGTTYYVRARGSYYLTDKTSLTYTPYCEARSFVYSAVAGVGSVEADGAAASIDGAGVLTVGEASDVAVYTVDGRMVYSAKGVRRADLSQLPKGVLVVRCGQQTLKYVH